MTTSNPSPIPVTLNVSAYTSVQQAFTAPVIMDSLTGSPVDLSTFISLTSYLVPNAPSPTATDATVGSTIGDNAGIVTLKTLATTFNGVSPGSAKLVIRGVGPAGGDALLLATGNFQLNQG
jgi:hypothetical protein